MRGMENKVNHSIKHIQKELKHMASKEDAQFLQRFFKTGKGEYGEGDKFLGIRVPALRKLAKECDGTCLKDVIHLLRSKFHEERMIALIFMVEQFKKGDHADKKAVYKSYLGHTAFINNWDLVDTSAEHIVGGYLLTRDRKPLYNLAKSKDLWERRIAILSTFHFIRQNQFEDTLTIAEILLKDREDLIHKAVGWMLREVGKRDMAAAEAFLKKHCREMPRTMLRYAIEKFPTKKRQKYLKGDVK
jgi:3-methyladenine DNA glycosylase AlkD